MDTLEGALGHDCRAFSPEGSKDGDKEESRAYCVFVYLTGGVFPFKRYAHLLTLKREKSHMWPKILIGVF